MAIHLPERTQSSTDAMTPRQIVVELDKHVIGQHKAKKAMAIAGEICIYTNGQIAIEEL